MYHCFAPLFFLFYKYRIKTGQNGPFLARFRVPQRRWRAVQNVSHLSTLEPPGWHRAGWGFRIAGKVPPHASLAVRRSPLARSAKNGQFWPVFGLFWFRLQSSSCLCVQKCLSLYYFMHGGFLSSIALFDRPLESLLLVVGDGLSDGVTVSACEW